MVEVILKFDNTDELNFFIEQLLRRYHQLALHEDNWLISLDNDSNKDRKDNEK